MRKFNIYEVFVEDDEEIIIKLLVPSPTKKEAETYSDKYGEVLKCRTIKDKFIPLNKLRDTLKCDGWGKAETDIIINTIDFTGLGK